VAFDENSLLFLLLLLLLLLQISFVKCTVINNYLYYFISNELTVYYLNFTILLFLL
jgi:hypothetical protein